MMEQRFEIQKRKILKEADIKPQVFDGMLKRLEQFVNIEFSSSKAFNIAFLCIDDHFY